MKEQKVLTAEDEPIATALHTMRNCTRKVNDFIRQYQPPMNGERYMTDKEVAQTLKVSRRTLQEYRTARMIPYIIFGGKVLYKEYDIAMLLEENYRKALY